MLTFNEDKHEYRWDTGTAKRLIPSVTQIMKACGISKDYSSVPVLALDKARRRGSAVHQITELIDKGLEPDMTMVDTDIYDDVCRMVDAWGEYNAQQEMPIIEREVMVYWIDEKVSDIPLYAGTADCIRQMDNGLFIPEEIKTTYQLSDDVLVQLVLCGMAYCQMVDGGIGGASAVRLDKKGKFHPWWVGLTDEGFHRVAELSMNTIKRYHNWEVHKNKRGMKRI
jgi:hypothetical protein